MVQLSNSSFTIESTEIEPDSLSYSKDGEYYNICIRVKKTAPLDCSPVLGVIEMAMTDAKGKSMTRSAEPIPLAEDAGSSYTFRFNLPVNAQPAVFTVDPGDKFYIKAKNRGYYFLDGFIHKQAYENYIINQSK
ncbi:MAG: hypothetical protein HYV28_15315 [Ignavibacteriales bacterium]|nr:hypothetical protein [Ignavibacteriales bacterium]